MDVIIDLSGPIMEGGTIIVVYTMDQPHMAAPVPDKRTARVESDFTFVIIPLGGASPGTLTFDITGEDAGVRSRIATKRLSVGSGSYDDQEGRRVTVDQSEIYHIFGPKTTEQQSYARGVYYTKYIAARLDCRPGEHLDVCTPRSRHIDAEVR